MTNSISSSKLELSQKNNSLNKDKYKINTNYSTTSNMEVESVSETISIAENIKHLYFETVKDVIISKTDEFIEKRDKIRQKLLINNSIMRNALLLRKEKLNKKYKLNYSEAFKIFEKANDQEYHLSNSDNLNGLSNKENQKITIFSDDISTKSEENKLFDQFIDHVTKKYNFKENKFTKYNIPKGIFVYPINKNYRTEDKFELEYMVLVDSYKKFNSILNQIRPQLENDFFEYPHNKEDNEKIQNDNLIIYLFIESLKSIKNKIPNAKKVCLATLINHFGFFLNKSFKAIYKCIYQLLKNLRKTIVQIKLQKTTNETRITMLRDNFCQVCYTYCCNMHNFRKFEKKVINEDFKLFEAKKTNTCGIREYENKYFILYSSLENYLTSKEKNMISNNLNNSERYLEIGGMEYHKFIKDKNTKSNKPYINFEIYNDLNSIKGCFFSLYLQNENISDYNNFLCESDECKYNREEFRKCITNTKFDCIFATQSNKIDKLDENNSKKLIQVKEMFGFLSNFEDPDLYILLYLTAKLGLKNSCLLHKIVSKGKYNCSLIHLLLIFLSNNVEEISKITSLIDSSSFNNQLNDNLDLNENDVKNKNKMNLKKNSSKSESNDYKNMLNYLITIKKPSSNVEEINISDPLDFFKNKIMIPAIILKKIKFYLCDKESSYSNFLNDYLPINLIDITKSKDQLPSTGYLPKKKFNSFIIKDCKANEYKPCIHKGVCNPETCDCVTTRGVCEKFCSCSLFCESLYTGCKCYPNECTEKCPCFENYRECDPDICRNCTSCKNTRIFRGDSKKVALGKANICDSFGLYALEDIEEGEYICDYKGEILNKDETERRSIFNDQLGLNYLFQLSNNSDIDAYRVGNEMRYVNHSAFGFQNCNARTMFVRSGNRVALFASRKISKLEELFFDYQIKVNVNWLSKYNRMYSTAKKN